jgi:hypothetical protein
MTLGAISMAVSAADVIKVSGRGEVPVAAVKRDKEQAAANQKALADAEEMAKRKAMKQAVFQVYGNKEALGPKADEILKAAADSSGAMILDKQVTSAGIQGSNAVVEMVVQVDGKALRDFLESNYNLSSTVQTEGRFRIYVLSYTIEGMDPSRDQPIVLHEETVEDQKAVHSSSHASSQVDASSQASASSFQGDYSSSDKGSAKYKSEASLSASGKKSASGDASASASGFGMGSRGIGGASAKESASFSASSSEKVKAKQSESGSANWDSKEAASVDARQSQSSASFSSSAKSGSAFNDTSRYYRRVVDYADPTKKGAGLSNEVRTEIEGMMTGAGFDVATLNVSMQNREFPTEDDLVNTVINELRQSPDVSPTDYVAIALNSFTPISVETHQFTSKVTYRVVRIKDGLALLPAKDITGDSGDRAPSDDVARTYAVKSAMLKVDEILPREIKQAVAKMQRADQREAASAAAYYVIVVDNASSMMASSAIRSALSSAGFQATRNFNGLAKTDTITVTLNGKTGQDVMNAVESSMDKFDVLIMNDQNARVRAK